MTVQREFATARVDGVELRSRYNFVPLNETVVPSPVAGRISHTRPLEDGLSGRIGVGWTAETPLLVGGASDAHNTNNEPFKIDGNRFAVPGSSLRGMLRSVLEIISYARMNFVDDGVFATRDLSCERWKDLTGLPAWDLRKVLNAGWLSKTETGYSLTPARWEKISVDDIISRYRTTEIEWHESGIAERYRMFGNEAHQDIDLSGFAPIDQDVDFKGLRGTIVTSGPLPDDEINRVRGKLAQLEQEAQGRGSGKKVKIDWKRSETVFIRTNEAPIPLDENAYRRFAAVQPKNQGQASNRLSWPFWSARLNPENGGPSQAIPVFFSGPLAIKDSDNKNFYMTLSRFVRVHHRQTVHEVLARSQTNLADHELDVVEAMMGWVPDEKGLKHIAPGSRKGRQQAWRSRVMVGQAIISNAVIGREPLRLVTNAPRASFHPFYLKANEKTSAQTGRTGKDMPMDWSNEAATLAGRKRYPVRNHTANQREVPRSPGKQPTDPVGAGENELFFLKARDGQSSFGFTSEIRFHNLHPIELGALLWAITLGQLGGDKQRRHMLGRSKAYGFGQLKAEVTGLAARTNKGEDRGLHDAASYLKAFENHMLKALGQDDCVFEQLPEIQSLLAQSNRSIGHRYRARLEWPQKPGLDNTGEAIVKGYQAIKNSAKQDTSVRLPDYPTE